MTSIVIQGPFLKISTNFVDTIYMVWQNGFILNPKTFLIRSGKEVAFFRQFMSSGQGMSLIGIHVNNLGYIKN